MRSIQNIFYGNYHTFTADVKYNIVVYLMSNIIECGYNSIFDVDKPRESSHPWNCQLCSNTNIEELWQEVKLSIYHPKPLPGLSLLAKINIFIFLKWETLNRKYMFALDEEVSLLCKTVDDDDHDLSGRNQFLYWNSL